MGEKWEEAVFALEKRIVVLETKVESIEDKLDDIFANTSWIIKLIIAMFITAIGAFVFKR